MIFLGCRPSSSPDHWIQSQSSGFDLVFRSVARDQKLVTALAIHLYGNGDLIVNEQRRIHSRPRLIGEQSVVSEPRPAFLAEVRQHWADHLHQ